VDSVEFDAFVRAGFVALTGVSSEEGVAVANGAGCKEKEKIFTVTCNGEPFTGTECIGETIVPAAIGFFDLIVYVLSV